MQGANQVKMNDKIFDLEHCWNEKIEFVGSAGILAHFNNGFPAVLCNNFGNGKVYYIACRSTELTRVVGRIAIKDSAVSALIQDNEMISSATSPDGKSRWVFNHSDKDSKFNGITLCAKDVTIIESG